MPELVESSMTRRDFVKGVVAGAVVAAIAAIGIEELRIAGMEKETTTATTTSTSTVPGPTTTQTSTSTITSTVPTTTTETVTSTTQVGTVTQTVTSTTTSPVTTTTTVPGPTTTRTVTSTTTVGAEVPVGLTREIVLNVNGEDYEVDVESRTSLLEVLNNNLQLTAAKDGCDQGECGSCTVLVDGVPTLSCLALAVEQVGKSIETLEGLAPSPDSLHPIQQAFLENDAFQCGFCTGGLVLATKALLEKVPSPTLEDVKYYLGGNLCKCSAYPHIVDAVLAV